IRDLIVTGVQTCALPIYRSDRAGIIERVVGENRHRLGSAHYSQAAHSDRIEDEAALIFWPRRSHTDAIWIASSLGIGACSPDAKIGRASCRERVEVAEVG